MHSRRFVFSMIAALASVGASLIPGAATIAQAATAGTLALSSATYSVAQNAGAVTITVNRTGGSVGSAAVSYTTVNGTATAGAADFTTEQAQLIWANGDSSPKTVRIPISNAKPFAGTKTFGFYIAHAQGAVLGSPASAIVTIIGSAETIRGERRAVVGDL